MYVYMCVNLVLFVIFKNVILFSENFNSFFVLDNVLPLRYLPYLCISMSVNKL